MPRNDPTAQAAFDNIACESCVKQYGCRPCDKKRYHGPCIHQRPRRGAERLALAKLTVEEIERRL